MPEVKDQPAQLSNQHRIRRIMRRRWMLALDGILAVLVVSMAIVDGAGLIFKLVFFLLTIAAFFVGSRQAFALRAAFWISITLVVLGGLVLAERASVTELIDIPFFLGVLVLVFAISKRRIQATEEFARLLQEKQDQVSRLAELADLKADFTAIVVHEFGNPLAALRRLSEMLRLDSLDGEAKEYVLDSVAAELSTLDVLVADVQGAVAVERDDFRLHRRPADVKELFADTEVYARSLGAAGDIELENRVPEGMLVSADLDRVGQILRNLVSNATKYSPHGSTITVRAELGEEETIRIEVEDRGEGIAQDDLEHIFEKFGRARSAGARKVHGVGLGLYISQRLVRAHGSELYVSSVPGKGSVFSFELPIAADTKGASR